MSNEVGRAKGLQSIFPVDQHGSISFRVTNSEEAAQLLDYRNIKIPGVEVIGVFPRETASEIRQFTLELQLLLEKFKHILG